MEAPVYTAKNTDSGAPALWSIPAFDKAADT